MDTMTKAQRSRTMSMIRSSGTLPEKVVAFDFETKGLEIWKHQAEPFLLGLEDEAGRVIIARPHTTNWDLAKRILADQNIEKVGWNVKYDLGVARHERMPVNGVVHDAMLMCYMNNEYEPNLKLKDVGKRHFGDNNDEELYVKKFLQDLKRRKKREVNYSDVPAKKMEEYLEKDLDLTMKAFWKFGGVRNGGQRRVYDIERRLIPNVIEIERWGIHVDEAYCRRMIREMGPRKAELERKLHHLAGVRFNLSSPAQVGQVLESLGLDTGARNKREELVADTDSLRQFKGRPFVDALLEWRSIQKVRGTYFDNFLKHAYEGVIHPHFWPFGTEDHGIKTGRMSCTAPAFQTIPGGSRGENIEVNHDPGLIRRGITPRPGYVFLFGDFDQIEYKIFACGVGDEDLLRQLRNGMDYHAATARLIFGRNCFDGKTKEECKKIRYAAKTINFSFIFGQGVKAYAQSAGIEYQEAARRKAAFFEAIPAAGKFLMDSEVHLIQDGCVQDQFGRRYHVPRDRAYKAANALCQGPAAIVMKRAINRVFERIKGLDAHPFITVHDELGLEVRREQVWDCSYALRQGMEDRENFAIPITVSMAVAEKSWADKVEWTKEEEAKWKIIRSR